MNKRLLRTAYHEAGHVAAQLFYKHPFKDVSIVAEGGSLGRVQFHLSRRTIEIVEHGLPSPGEERHFQHEMIILMAGGESEGKLIGKKNISKGRGSDVATLVRYCEAIGIYDKALYYYSGFIIEEAKNLVNSEAIWTFIEVLSNMLITRQVIKYRECKNLYKEVCGYLHFR